MYGNKQAAYRETEVLSSSPERLIPIMYEKLLVSLKRGIHCVQGDDAEGRFEHLQRALDIVYELMGSLDFERGGEIAQRLSSLYAFWSKEISDAGRARDVRRLGRVSSMVAELHQSWQEAVRSVESGDAGVGAGGGGP